MKNKSGKPGDYEIGYGKPPKKFQFKPGQSGNPPGRPRKAPEKKSLQESLDTIVFEEAARLISTTENGRKARMSAAQALVRLTIVEALKGNKRSMGLILNLLARSSAIRESYRAELRQNASDYCEVWHAEAKRRRRDDDKRPMPYPHPDDVSLDEHGSVWVAGPLSAEERPHWDRLRQMRKDLEFEIAAVQEDLANPNRELRYDALLREELRDLQRRLQRIAHAMKGTGPAH